MLAAEPPKICVQSQGFCGLSSDLHHVPSAEIKMCNLERFRLPSWSKALESQYFTQVVRTPEAVLTQRVLTQPLREGLCPELGGAQ